MFTGQNALSKIEFLKVNFQKNVECFDFAPIKFLNINY